MAETCLYQDHSPGKFTCGCCRQDFPAICQLHRHLGVHSAQSYHYDHHLQMAFPKYDVVCAYVQTDKLLKSNQDGNETLETGMLKSDKLQSKENINSHTNAMSVSYPQNEDQGNIDCDKDIFSEGFTLNRKSRITYSKSENGKGTEISYSNALKITEEHTDKSTEVCDTSSQTMTLDLGISQECNNSEQKTCVIIESKDFKCQHKDCSAAFSSKKALRLHVAEHSGKTLLSCNFCKKQFVHMPALQVHLRFHLRDQSKESNVTEQNAVDTPSVSYVEKKPTNKCDTCNAAFLSKSQLKSHERSHKEKQFVCSKCPKVFSTKQGLTVHSNLHEGIKFECDVCGREYSHANTLKKHKVQHSQDTQFQCKICGRHFAIQSLYKKHMTCHTREKQFTCEVCGFQTHCSSILKAHGSVHCEKQFKCAKCSKTFSRKAALLEHVHTHLGLKPYVCEYCAMSFAYQSSLVTHLRIHTGQRPYRCETCSRTFSLQHVYTRHLRTHSNERPYRCTVCDKAFTQEYNRAVHMRQHSGEKPYVCEVCARRFTQKCSLKNHMSKCHNDQDSVV